MFDPERTAAENEAVGLPGAQAPQFETRQQSGAAEIPSPLLAKRPLARIKGSAPQP